MKKSDYQKQFDRLMGFEGEAEDKLACCQQAIDLAELHGDPWGSFIARLEFICTGMFNARHEEDLVHFVKCIEISREHPQYLESHGNLMAVIAKSTVGSVACYAAVTRSQIDGALNQMKSLYERAGWNERAIHKVRMNLAYILGNVAELPVHRERWRSMPPDKGSDCDACETASLCKSYLDTNQLEEALELGAPLIDAKLKCGSEPGGTDAALLVPLLRAGKLSLAQRLMRRTLPELHKKSGYFDDTGRFMAYLAATGQFTRAVKVFETGLRFYPKVRRDWDRFWMLAGSCVLLKFLTARGRVRISLHVPSEIPWHRSDDRYAIKEIAAWTDAEVRELARRFDLRNGNHHFSGILRDFERLLDNPISLPRTIRQNP